MVDGSGSPMPVVLLPLLAGGLFGIYGLYRLFRISAFYRRAAGRASWPAAHGVVVDSIVRHTTSNVRGGRRYWAEVYYSYSVPGSSEYRGKFKIDHLWGSEAEANRDALRHLMGTTLPIHYNPERPQEVIALPEKVSPYDLVITIFFLFTGVFVGCPAFLWWVTSR
jgi:hypothetical protein